MTKNPEADLAKLAITYFEQMGYTIYKEVCLSGGGTIRADLYAKKDNETIAIEIKMNMNLKIIEQGFKWRPYANYTYIIIPYKSKTRNLFAEQICQDYGIGVLYYRTRLGIQQFEEMIKPTKTLYPKNPELYKEQLDSEASNNRSEFVTPFKLTTKRLIDYVKLNGKVTLHKAIENIEHHYKNNGSATNALKNMIKTGVIKELKLIKDGKITYLISL